MGWNVLTVEPKKAIMVDGNLKAKFSLEKGDYMFLYMMNQRFLWKVLATIHALLNHFWEPYLTN